MLELQKEYLDRIIALCKENDIQLILTFTPCIEDKIGKHNTVKEYAQEKGLSYINFGEESVYDAMGYDYSQDNADNSHPNPQGSVKITDYLGNFLTTKCGLTAHKDSQWEKSESYYRTFMLQASLVREDDAEKYAEGLGNERLLAFIYVKNPDSDNSPERVRKALKKYGLTDSFFESDDLIHAAVIESGDVLKTSSDLKTDTESGSAKGVMENGTDQYQFIYSADGSGTVTGGFSINNIASNLSNGNNTVGYEKELEDGITILVYDKIMMRETDKVHISGQEVRR